MAVQASQHAPSRVVSVLIADDDIVVRRVLAALIDKEPTLELAGVAHDAEDAIAGAGRSKPDVAMLDWHMPGGGGPEAARGIAESSPDTRIVAFSSFDKPEMARQMVDAGATRVLTKDAPSWRILGAIRAAASAD